MRRRGVAAGAFWIAVLLAPAPPAVAALPRASIANRAEARVVVARQLAAVSLPAGATSVGVGRGGSTRAPGCTSGDTNMVYGRGHWRAPEHPASVVRWVRGHAPGRWHRIVVQHTNTRAGGILWYLELGAPARPGHVIDRCLAFAVTRTAGGGSDVAIVSEAAWVLTRPRWDYVPRGARVVTVTSDVNGDRARAVTLVAPGTVKRIRRLINGSRVVQPHGFSTCFFSSVTRTYLLVFRARSGGPTLAVAKAVINGCSSLSLSARGRPGPPLADGWGLAKLLQTTGAAPGPRSA